MLEDIVQRAFEAIGSETGPFSCKIFLQSYLGLF
jgi:hypothetical protein